MNNELLTRDFEIMPDRLHTASGQSSLFKRFLSIQFDILARKTGSFKVMRWWHDLSVAMCAGEARAFPVRAFRTLLGEGQRVPRGHFPEHHGLQRRH
jgi:hypothetical protein